MRVQFGDRVELRLAALERIATSGLDEARQYLLVNFVETYLTMSEDELPAYEQRLSQGGHMAVQALEMTWGERLREEGREGGRKKAVLAVKREVLLDQLRIRFGEVPEELATTIAQADDIQITNLLHKAVLVAGLEELEG
jgi:hypothetical protein